MSKPNDVEASGADDQTTDEKASETPIDDIYDGAFDEFLGDGSPDPDDQEEILEDEETVADPEGEQSDDGNDRATQGDKANGDSLDDAGLTQTDIQVLKRSHLSPEMVKSWTPEQRAEVLENLRKRETDTSQTYQQQQAEIQRLKAELAGDSQKTQQKQETPANNPEPPDSSEPEEGSWEAFAAKHVDQVTEVFGDDYKPAAEATRQLGKVADQLTGQLKQAETRVNQSNALIVEMMLDNGIQSLVTQYPSLDKADAQKRVVDRFKRDWATAGNPHREGDGPYTQRVRAALADAAKAEFGTVTEAAASTALVNKTKTRLKTQPKTGRGKARKTATTVDDVYDEAFEETMGDSG